MTTRLYYLSVNIYHFTPKLTLHKRLHNIIAVSLKGVVKMLTQTLQIIAIPFAGTVFGAAFVFFIGKELDPLFEKILSGFAAGIMLAAAIWSLILPALELSSSSKITSILPAVLGVCSGIAVFVIADKLLVVIKNKSNNDTKLTQKQSLPFLAVTIHNIPEGMALGIIYAAWENGNTAITYSAVLATALGIGIQNIPEGAIISTPIYVSGSEKTNAFMLGVASAFAETLGTAITLILAGVILPILPYLMCFAAGAMIYVVISELCPEMNIGAGREISNIVFAIGFCIMMTLDVVLS